MGGVDDQNEWLRLTTDNPEHSRWYIDRFRKLAADGADLGGEARMLDAMVARGARILDAGCGTGRVGGLLADAGHEVVGVDFDAVLLAAARADHPGATWVQADLATLDLPAQGVAEGFDLIFSAGNVLAFLAPSTRREVLRRLRAHLRGDGRVVTGFGAGRGYPFEEFRADARAAGLAADVLLSTWDLRPFTDESTFLVAVLSAG